MKHLIAIITTVVLGITFLTSCAQKPSEVKMGYVPTSLDLPLTYNIKAQDIISLTSLLRILDG